jgi:hypothetical protein
MGNQNSNQTNKSLQNGSGYPNNVDDLQNRIENMIKRSNFDSQGTIGFNKNSITETIDSMSELQQNGGSIDYLTNKTRRIRYANPIAYSSITSYLDNLVAPEHKNLLNVATLNNIMNERQTGQSGGSCGCSGNVSPSPNPVDYNILSGGGKKNKFVVTSDSSLDMRSSSFSELGNDDVNTTDDSDSVELTPEENDKTKIDDSDEESDDKESDDGNSDDEEDTKENKSPKRQMSRRRKAKDSSSSSSSSSVSEVEPLGTDLNDSSSTSSTSFGTYSIEHRIKKSKHVSSDDSQFGGDSSDVVIDTKFIYSSDSPFHGSESSEKYANFRNRTRLR